MSTSNEALPIFDTLVKVMLPADVEPRYVRWVGHADTGAQALAKAAEETLKQHPAATILGFGDDRHA